ncbi:hypothetical protein L9F63_004827 [Diploptera punctata]|uniref:Protein msta n=1 Tax=Diploptera punctata TaxID=6984 RepID=A0AAD8E711_DIPPU|nr:hypothetical protein L9F63_004827 [Diploptera punctata]
MSDDVKCDVCSAPAAHKCSACKQVAYCSKEHQKEDWKKHKSACRPFEIRSSPELGKYLVASRDLSPGDVIISEQPLIVGPKLHSEQPICLGCHVPTRFDSEYRCPKCLWPFCGPSCPADPRIHGPECVILRLQAKKNLEAAAGRDVSIYHYDAVTPLRCLALQRRNPRKWEQIMGMEAHLKHRGQGTDTYREVRDRVVSFLQDNYLKKLSEVDKEGDALLSDTKDTTLHKICGVLDVNGLEIRLPLGSEVVALYPTVYLMEHNCLPNTRHSFDICPGERQHRVTVTATTHIPKGEHIATMYTHALWGTQARREHLYATKYFMCKCKRCSDPTELGTYLSALRCLGVQINSDGKPDGDGATCGGTQLPASPLDDKTDWRCDRCPAVLSSAEVSDIVGRIGDEVDNIQAGGPTVKQLEELLSKLLTILHPHHYHIYSVKHSLVQLYGHQQGYQTSQLSDSQLERKTDICKELLQITDTLDPGSSRLCLYSSVLIHELHSAEFNLARRKLEKDPPTISPEDFSNKMQELKSLLQRAVKTLEVEPEFSAGSRMLEFVRKSLTELENWRKT